MKKRGPIRIKDAHGFGTDIEWVGPAIITKDAQPYLRLEDEAGHFVGALTLAQMEKLKGWLNQCFAKKAMR